MRPSWDELFMGMAVTVAHRSNDPNTQVGAVIVSPQRIVMGVGYNGHPRGCTELPTTAPEKYMVMAHAELNAVINCSLPPRGCTLYCLMEPCNVCTQYIINAQIREVVFLREREEPEQEYLVAREMFNQSHVNIRRFQGDLSWLKTAPLVMGQPLF